MSRPPIFESYSSELPPPEAESKPVSLPAVLGLVVALLQCVPVLAGVGGVILGGIGVSQTRNKRAIGRVPAVLAIVIGALSIPVWATALGFGLLVQARMTDATAVGDRFVEALSENRLDAARALAADEVTDEQLREWRDALFEPESPARVRTVGDTGAAIAGPNPTGLWWFVEGPWVIRSTVHYGEDLPDQPSAKPARRADVTVARIDGRFRPRNLRVRPVAATGRVTIDGHGEFDLPDVPGLEGVPGIRVVPPPRPATVPATRPGSADGVAPRPPAQAPPSAGRMPRP